MHKQMHQDARERRERECMSLSLFIFFLSSLCAYLFAHVVVDVRSFALSLFLSSLSSSFFALFRFVAQTHSDSFTFTSSSTLLLYLFSRIENVLIFDDIFFIRRATKKMMMTTT